MSRNEVMSKQKHVVKIKGGSESFSKESNDFAKKGKTLINHLNLVINKPAVNKQLTP